MKYPDGKEIKVGDIIWYHNNIFVGRVLRILETQEQINSFRFTSPGIFITPELSRHYEKGESSFYEASYFGDIGLVMMGNNEWVKILDKYEKTIKKISSPLLNEIKFRAEPIYDEKNEINWRLFITFSVCNVHEL